MPTDPATRPNPVFALLVGFDFDRGHSPASLPPLKGMVNDVLAWWRVLRDVGVPAAHVTLVTDQPVEALKKKLVAAGLAEPDLLDGGLHQATDHASMWTARKAFSARITAVDADARAAAGRLLIAWGGHGGVIRDAGSDAPVLYLPNGEHWAVLQLMTFGPLVGAEFGENHGPPRVLAFIGACHSGSDLFSDIDDDNVLTSAKFGIPSLAASSCDAAAHEIQVDGTWRGAMAWAATTVLSRFEPQADGSLALSYSELYYRMRNLLAAVDVKDEPLLFVPSGELNRNILRQTGDKTLGLHAAKGGHPIEIYPTTDCEVLVASIEGAAVKGKVLTVGGGKDNWDSSWQNAGYDPERMYFIWDGSPDWASFDLQPAFESKKVVAWDMKSSLSSQGGIDLENLPASTTVESFPLSSWSKKSKFTAKPSHVIKAGSVIQRWVDVRLDANNKRSLTFYRRDDQADQSSKSVRLSFRTQSDDIDDLTYSVTETIS